MDVVCCWNSFKMAASLLFKNRHPASLDLTHHKRTLFHLYTSIKVTGMRRVYAAFSTKRKSLSETKKLYPTADKIGGRV